MGKSKYDDYFEKLSKEEATCKICGVLIKCLNRSTTGMKKHLQNKHNIILFTEDKLYDSHFHETDMNDKSEPEAMGKSKYAIHSDNFNDSDLCDPSDIDIKDGDGTMIKSEEDMIISSKAESNDNYQKKSKYSEYFNIKDNVAICLTCDAILKCSNGNTSAIKYHAEKKHNLRIQDKTNHPFKAFSESVVKENSPKKKSKYSEHFDIQGNIAVCLTCQAVIKCTSGNTKGMKSHAEKKHNINFREKSNEPILEPHEYSYDEYNESQYEITEENPWNILSLYEFLVFDCPSCAYKSNLKQEFIYHLCELHPEAIENLKNISDGSTSDIICPWEETDVKFEASENYADENYDIFLEANSNEPKIEIKNEMIIEDDYYDANTKTTVESGENFHKKSKYLEYFNIKDNAAICLTCDAIIKCTDGSTSAMKYHAEKKHSIKIENNRSNNLLKVFSKSVVDDENSLKKKSKYSEYFDIRGPIAVCRTCQAVIQCTNGNTTGMKSHSEKKHNIRISKANFLHETFSNTPVDVDKKSKYHKYYEMRGKVAKCLKCDAIIKCTNSNTSGLKSHVEKIHGIILDSTVLDSEGKILVRPKPAFRKKRIKNSDLGPGICDLCGKEYENNQKLRDHRRYCRKSKQKEFKRCEFCNKTYSSLSLKSHIKAVHKKIKDHICETCGKPFFSKSDLRIHMAVHFGNQLACDQCGKTYRDKYRMKEHIKIAHEGRRDYPCSHCGKAFPTRRYQKLHEDIVHLGIKRHKCHLCSNAYGQSHELKSHYRRAHNLDPNLVKKKQKEEALEICKSKYPDV